MSEFLIFIAILAIVILFITITRGPSNDNRKYKGSKAFREKYCETNTDYSHNIPLKENDVLKEHGKDYAFMIFDCETTGLPKDGPAYIIQLSWMLLDKDFKTMKKADYYIKPPIQIPEAATAINHITNEDVETKGSPLDDVLIEFHLDALKSYRLVAHNFDFDAQMIDFESSRLNLAVTAISNKAHICTMKKGAKYCQILKANGQYKFPKLSELAQECKVQIPDDMHNSMTDVRVTARCLKHMLDYYVIKIKGINW